MKEFYKRYIMSDDPMRNLELATHNLIFAGILFTLAAIVTIIKH